MKTERATLPFLRRKALKSALRIMYRYSENPEVRRMYKLRKNPAQ
jgi:hypothetical protein